MCICEDKEKIESALICITAVSCVWQVATACADSPVINQSPNEGQITKAELDQKWLKGFVFFLREKYAQLLNLSRFN